MSRRLTTGRNLPLLLAFGLFALITAPSCESDAPNAQAELGGGCRLNSDCHGGLSCAYGVCHEECAVSSDCEAGRCVMGPAKVHLCQPDAGASCTFNSDCLEPLVCARDGQCRNQCAADRDCIRGQRCSSATCADPEELDESGQLEQSGEALGTPCLRNSDCGTAGDFELVCRAGSCGYACFTDKDCGRFLDCSTADDASTPGNCEPINENPAKLRCDPDFDPEVPCRCPSAPNPTVPCKANGEGYEDCQCLTP